MRLAAVGLAGLMLSGCFGGSTDDVETLRIQRSDFEITLRAEGELRAARSTVIRPPAGSHEPRTISWMAPNHSAVKKGQVIARFDTSDVEQDALKTGIELNKVDIQAAAKQRELERLLSELGGDIELVDVEKLIADKFTVEDTLAYSRHEIIDATRDKALLEYRSGHLEQKKENYNERESAEMDVLEAMRTTQQAEQQEQQQQIEHSEVTAPHDGFIVYEKNWWGQPVAVGSSVFPENNIARIPDLNKMEAVLKVLETEAVGLAAGQRAELTIDAFPDRPLSGVVKSISATATPIARDVPVKYFTVVVSLDEANPTWITSEAQVTAEIHINSIPNTIAIPNQAIFQDNAGDWVLVRNGSGLESKRVNLGVRGPDRSEVLSGLKAGEEIALYPPEGWKM
jgi:RND family efflux transporter MFP subunit